jgi:2-haloacid dehalogenase
MIDAIIFDVAGVIVVWDKMAVVEPEESDLADFLNSELWETINYEVDRGMTRAQAQDRAVQVDPRLGELFGLYADRWDRTVRGLIPGTTELIDELQGAGYPVFGLSNWAAWNFAVARRTASVIQRFEGLIVSGEVGLAKPGLAIYELAVERFGVNPATTVFIDDRPENLTGAEAAGFQTVLFTSAAQVRAELIDLGVRLNR